MRKFKTHLALLKDTINYNYLKNTLFFYKSSIYGYYNNKTQQNTEPFSPVFYQTHYGLVYICNLFFLIE